MILQNGYIALKREGSDKGLSYGALQQNKGEVIGVSAEYKDEHGDMVTPTVKVGDSILFETDDTEETLYIHNSKIIAIYE